VAKGVGAPGYGPNGFGPGLDFNRPEDFYLKMVANVAWGDKDGDAVAEASDAELALFRKARRHLPPAVFDEAKWTRAAGQKFWRRVVYVLNRGGRFEAAAKAYSGAYAGHAWGKLLALYVEPVGSAKHSITSERLSGVPQFERMKHLDGKLVEAPPEYDLALTTYKEIFGTQSRTVGNYAGQQALLPENFIYLNKLDATRLGLRDGDIARVVSPTFNGEFDVTPGMTSRVEGKVKAISGLRPGTIAVSFHFGHWAYGANDVTIDGVRIPGDKTRRTGLSTNPAVLVDGYLKDVCLTDPIAGDSVFNGTSVKLVKIASGHATGMPRAGYLNEGPRMSLAQPKDADDAQWVAQEALKVAQGRSRSGDLQAHVARRVRRAQ